MSHAHTRVCEGCGFTRSDQRSFKKVKELCHECWKKLQGRSHQVRIASGSWETVHEKDIKWKDLTYDDWRRLFTHCKLNWIPTKFADDKKEADAKEEKEAERKAQEEEEERVQQAAAQAAAAWAAKERAAEAAARAAAMEAEAKKEEAKKARKKNELMEEENDNQEENDADEENDNQEDDADEENDNQEDDAELMEEENDAEEENDNQQDDAEEEDNDDDDDEEEEDDDEDEDAKEREKWRKHQQKKGAASLAAKVAQNLRQSSSITDSRKRLFEIAYRFIAETVILRDMRCQYLHCEVENKLIQPGTENWAHAMGHEYNMREAGKHQIGGLLKNMGPAQVPRLIDQLRCSLLMHNSCHALYDKKAHRKQAHQYHCGKPCLEQAQRIQKIAEDVAEELKSV